MGFFKSKRDRDVYDGEPGADNVEGAVGGAVDGPIEGADEAGGEGEVDGTHDGGSPEPVVVPRPQGPWDSDDLPADDVRERLDLGGLRIFVPADVELRVDLDPNSQVVAATLVHDEELMQLGAFAAPRTEPIWGEVRAEIAESVTDGGGSVSEAEGPFGTELRARVPTDQPGVYAPARFLGVSGPRWFLRALITGPKAAEGIDDPALLEALRNVVVVRGTEAMAPRDGLALRLPKDAQASAEAAIAEATGQPAGESAQLPELPERGPEITETR